MLLLLSSGVFELVENGCHAVGEGGVGAFSGLESLDSPVGNFEAGGDVAHGQPVVLSAKTECWSDGFSGGGVDQGRVDLVGDVAFEATHDVAVGQPFCAPALEVGHGAWLLMA